MVVIWLRFLCDTHPTLLSGRRFVAMCDNDPFVAAVNNRRSNHPQIAFLIGLIHHMSCQFGFDFRLEYITSKKTLQLMHSAANVCLIISHICCLYTTFPQTNWWKSR